MSSAEIRCNLGSASFPLVSELWGRSIMVPTGDENYDSSIVSTVERGKDKGIPQIYYTHNCMPSVEGFQSIGYQEYVVSLAGANDFDQMFPIQNNDLHNFLFVPAAGKNYVFDRSVGHWSSCSPYPVGLVPANCLVSHAFVQSQSYVFYDGIGCLKYNSTTHTMDAVALTGLTIANIHGICEASGYMIAWTDTAIARSSASNPLDFIPSLATGAGGGNLEQAHGKILFCSSFPGGFLVYCEENIIAAKYTGNANYPFAFTEINSSAGITNAEDVSYQDNNAVQYALTTSGLQKVDFNNAASVYPEVSDFLGKLIFEDYDELTGEFTQEYLASPLYHKINGVCSRYLVISYGKTQGMFTHAVVLDYVLGRFGKLKIDHTDIFEWNNPDVFGDITYDDLTAASITYDDLQYTTYNQLLAGVTATQPILMKKLAILQSDGTVKIVNFDLSESEADGVLLLGKYQYIRSRFLVHQKTTVETVVLGNNFSMQLIPTLDGKTFMPPVDPVLLYNQPKSRVYAKRLEGMNISLMLKGAFNLTSVLLNFTLGSARQARE